MGVLLPQPDEQGSDGRDETRDGGDDGGDAEQSEEEESDGDEEDDDIWSAAERDDKDMMVSPCWPVIHASFRLCLLCVVAQTSSAERESLDPLWHAHCQVAVAAVAYNSNLARVSYPLLEATLCPQLTSRYIHWA